MTHSLEIIGMAIAISIGSQSAVAFDGKVYSPANVTPFLSMNSLGLEVKLFDAFGDRIKLPKEVLFKYVYIKYVGGSPIMVNGIDIQSCFYFRRVGKTPLGDKFSPFELKSGDESGFITFGSRRPIRTGKRPRGIYPCKPVEVTIHTDWGDVTYQF
jgi:hypothetical protein